MNLELKKAIEQMCKDRGIDKDILVETLLEAVRNAVKKRCGEDADMDVRYIDESGDIEVFQYKRIVEEVEDPFQEITIEEAQEFDSSAQLGDELGFRIKVEDLGRIAAQSAKQMIIQRVRDAEQEQIYDEFKDRVGEIVSGLIQRWDRGGCVINLGRTEALLRKDGQIPHENYRRGDRVQAVIVEVNTGKDKEKSKGKERGPQVIISRTDGKYLEALFRREVPEVDDGTVQIMGVARDPGLRAKVAVFSRDRDIDPVGSCVGVRGSRIQSIVQELHGEHIDIVVWSPDLATYAANALAPAHVERIVADESTRKLRVIVLDKQQQTSAIGKKGINVRLAADLLGWSIEICTEEQYAAANADGISLERAARVAEIPLERLTDAGFRSVKELSAAADDELKEKLGLNEARISDLRRGLSLLTPASGDNEGDRDA